MKFLSSSLVAGAIVAAGLTLAYGLQLPGPQAVIANHVSWSRPALVSDCGVEMRHAFVRRGNQPVGTALLVLRFESMSPATVAALVAAHPNLALTRPPISGADVLVDRPNDALPGTVYRGSPSADGTGAIEVAIPAPAGGWYQQPLRFVVKVRSGDRELLTSDSLFTLAP